MKKLILLLALIPGIRVQAQFVNFCVNFEDPEFTEAVTIDTVAYPDNLWQIGHPQKPGFDYAYTQPNAIVTDTLEYYPANTVSAFTIMNQVSYGFYYDLVLFEGWYFVQSDSLNDFGRMEFSADNGTTWIDLIHDTLYPANFQWFQKPELTGNSDGWQRFEMMLADIGSIFNIQMGDTIFYRFTFVSDSTSESLGGLMFDDICFAELIEGISETRFRPVKTKIYPNPSQGDFTLDFENPRLEYFELAVYDEKGQRISEKENVGGTTVQIQGASYKPGNYFYKLTNNNLKERGWGKFVVSR